MFTACEVGELQGAAGPSSLDFDVALAASPVLFGDTVILQCDGTRKSSRLVAFDRKTGETAWEQKRPTNDFSHSTPTLAKIDGKDQLLVAGSNTLQGVDPANGKVIWSVAARGDTVSPVVGGGVAYIDSGRGGQGFAVDPTGSGDVTKTHLKWKANNVPEGFSSPVIVGEHIYRIHSPAILKCWKRDSGEVVFSEQNHRLACAHWALHQQVACRPAVQGNHRRWTKLSRGSLAQRDKSPQAPEYRRRRPSLLYGPPPCGCLP